MGCGAWLIDIRDYDPFYIQHIVPSHVLVGI